MEKLTIAGLDDAIGALDGIRDRFGYGHSAVCLDDLWCVRDLTVFTDTERHDHSSALDWACCAILNDDHIHRIVLLSSVVHDVGEAREDDVREYALMRSVFAERGVEVVDWILSDGEQYRSMAITTEPDTAWGGTVSAGTDAWD